MADTFDVLRGAICLIRNGDQMGTGYLVQPDFVATCEHVVRGKAEGSEITMLLGGKSVTGNVHKIDKDSDAALVKLKDPSPVSPLPLAGACMRQAAWDGYGFPGIADGMPVPLSGTVSDPRGKDRKERPSLILFSKEAAAGMASKVHGFSGSPVVVEGAVVGHLKRILSDDEETQRPAFGTLWATPSTAVLQLLGMEPAVKEVASAPTGSLRVPELAADESHAFVSFSAANRPWAVVLADELEQRGLTVQTNQFTLPGIASAAARSAVVLITPSWLNSKSCQEEAAILRQRSAGGFRLVPVWLDGAELPEPWSQMSYIDCRQSPLPSEAQLKRILFRLMGQHLPSEAYAAEMSEADLWPQAESLINMGQAWRALRILPADSSLLRTRQLYALALSDTGDVERAISILKQLRDEGNEDGETSGLLAGRYRRFWEETNDRRWFNAAFNSYKQAWDRSQGAFPGINTAAMLLWQGKTEEAMAVARNVEAAVKEPRVRDHWYWATVAECALIQGEIEKARELYGKAVDYDPRNARAIGSMRRNARRTLDILGRTDLVDEMFPIPKVVAFVGHCIDRIENRRFPAGREAEVRKAIRERLAKLEADFGVSCATDGGDLLFLEELLRRPNTQARVLLPCPQGQFARQYVNSEGDWQKRLKQVLANDRVEIVEITDSDDPQDVWAEFRPRLKNDARAQAFQLDQKPMLLALWNRGSGYIADTVRDWQSEEWPVSTLLLEAADSQTA